MRAQDKQQLDRLTDSVVSFSRNKLNALLFGAASSVARTSGSLTTLLILVVLGCNVLLFLSIALAFWLSSLLGGSLAWGFLIVAGIYLLLMLLYLLLRSRTEACVRNRVAAQALRASGELNEGLDRVAKLRLKGHVVPYAQQWAGRPAYTAMVEMQQEAHFKADYALKQANKSGSYFVYNYKEVAKQAAFAEVEARVPGRKFVTPLLKLLGYRPTPRQPRAEISAPRQSGSRVRGLEDYMPYIKFAVEIIRPVLVTFAISRLRGGIGYLLGLTARRRGKR